MAQQQDGERPVRHLVGVTLRLALLHLIEDLLRGLRVVPQLDPQAARLGDKRRLAGKLAHEHAGRVAHVFGARVFVRLGEPRDRAGMQPAFVGEC